MNVGRVVDPGPALDPGEQPLYPRPVAPDDMALLYLLVDAPRAARADHPVARRILPEDRNKVLHARELEDIGIDFVPIERDPLRRLARHRRKGKLPAEPEGSVARSGIVGKGEGGREAGAAGTDRQRNGRRPGARDGVGSELLAHASDRPAALGKRRRLDRAPTALAGTGGRIVPHAAVQSEKAVATKGARDRTFEDARSGEPAVDDPVLTASPSPGTERGQGGASRLPSQMKLIHV